MARRLRDSWKESISVADSTGKSCQQECAHDAISIEKEVSDGKVIHAFGKHELVQTKKSFACSAGETQAAPLFSGSESSIKTSKATKNRHFQGDEMARLPKKRKLQRDDTELHTKKATVVNCKVKYIRPKYKNLEDWCNDSNNIYIGRAGVVFVNKIRFPKKSSIWCNPFKITLTSTREEVVEQYETYIKEKILSDPKTYDLRMLRGKNLGCWCCPELCHGDVLAKLVNGG
eukprot:CAMPEP_0195542382 /NCGR_PEP_ID=MMETSP0794_2-20130614/51576_1 /TAXON_ID=515487 /ORGANISM="Stephanopyxis turris, Strain CCMP 815" /LENGTH=230 /DNA_ID=CAMNT_0040676515 /DNA_START=394 /DNA_END=1082 /DNA_ORIENTATION=-